MPQPLEGISVLDFSHGMAGSIATMVMADFGAEVIKVEPPGGHRFHAGPPSRQWDRGKKSVTLDLKTGEGRRDALALSRRSHVVIESYRPGVATRLGVGYKELGGQRPDLVYCSISAWGPTGPYARYKGYEGLVEAKTGRMMWYAGQTQREGPHYPTVSLASYAAGMAAVRGVTAALHVREATGNGQKVETSLVQAISYYDFIQWLLWQMMARDPETWPSDNLVDYARQPNLAYQNVRTKDGKWFQTANHMVRLFQAELRAIGLEHIVEDPRYEYGRPRITGEPQEELRQMILEKMAERTLDEWIGYFLREVPDVAGEPYMTALEGMEHPQVVHNAHVVEVDDPEAGRMRQVGAAFFLSETPGSIKGPAPIPGEHTARVLENARGRPEVAGRKGNAPLPLRPFEGVTVLDFSTVIAGPMAGTLLGELGARVIRVENIPGDHVRGLQPRGIAANRTMAGAHGICLDLKTPEGRKIIHQLVQKTDVLLHNMRPGAPRRIGIDFETVREINPDLIYLYLAGYGSSGPYSKRPAMFPIGSCVSGSALAQAGPGFPPSPDTPLTIEEVREVGRRLGRAQEMNPDHSTAQAAATALSMALYARRRFGVAQYLETTLICASAYANSDDFFDYPGRPPRPGPDAEGYGLNALYRLYPAASGWVFLACPMPHEWPDLCRALERDDLERDPRFSTEEARARHDHALAAELQAIFRTQGAADWERELTSRGVGCVKAEDRGMYHFFAEDPHVREGGFTVEVENPRIGRYWRHLPILTFSKTPCVAGTGPLKGQHTAGILADLGYSAEDIASLKQRGIIDWEEP